MLKTSSIIIKSLFFQLVPTICSGTTAKQLLLLLLLLLFAPLLALLVLLVLHLEAHLLLAGGALGLPALLWGAHHPHNISMIPYSIILYHHPIVILPPGIPSPPSPPKIIIMYIIIMFTRCPSSSPFYSPHRKCLSLWRNRSNSRLTSCKSENWRIFFEHF